MPIYKELDNFQVKDLNYILNEDTTLKRYYPLVKIKTKLIDFLLKENITYKYDFLKADYKRLNAKSGISDESFALLSSFFHLHDFKERKISEIECINPELKKSLINNGIKYSSSFISLYKNNSLEMLMEKYKAEEKDLNKLYSICNLMRLPGVKNVRANLYYSCGYRTLLDFSSEDATIMQKVIASCIEKEKLNYTVPLLKELKTQIAFAKIYS